MLRSARFIPDVKDAIVFKDDAIVFKDDAIVFKNDAVVFKDDAIVFKDDAIVFKDYAIASCDRGKEGERAYSASALSVRQICTLTLSLAYL